MRSPAWLVPALSLLTACNLLTERPSEPSMIGGPEMPTPMPTGPSVPLEVGPTQVAKRTLPPISGGTLAVGRAGATEVAVASDPEHDKVWVIDPKKSKPQAVSFEEGAEPGRAVLTGQQAVVALRRAGELAVIDVAKGELSWRIPVCAAPRGIDVDQAADLLAVACMGGELKLYRASTLEPVASYQLDRDLRDVVIRGEEILVTRFRSAEVLVVLKDGTMRDRAAPAPASVAGASFNSKGSSVQPAQSTASVAWRMVSSADGGAVVLHQRGTDGQVQVTQPGGYGGTACGGIVQSALSSVNKGKLISSGASARASRSTWPPAPTAPSPSRSPATPRSRPAASTRARRPASRYPAAGKAPAVGCSSTAPPPTRARPTWPSPRWSSAWPWRSLRRGSWSARPGRPTGSTGAASSTPSVATTRCRTPVTGSSI